MPDTEPHRTLRLILGDQLNAKHSWLRSPDPRITNTRGMSQFADGGLVGTKPYVTSAAYISRMSDYCKTCSYDPKSSFGPSACPFKSLYWHFYIRHRALLEGNPRIGFVYKTLDRMSADDRSQLLAQAESYLKRIEEL
jgi:deoxyribodipyrimidine photolyase-related protein